MTIAERARRRRDRRPPRRLAAPLVGHLHERHAPLGHHVEYILDTATWIGPSRATTGDDARAVAELIRSSGLKAEGFDDLRPMQWSKLIFNATVNAVAALTGLPHEPRFAELDRARAISATSSST